MFTNIFLKTLRDMRTALFWWVLGLFLMSLYVIALYPTIQKNSQQLQDYVDSMPKGMLAMMGMDNGQFDYTTLNGYLSMEMFSFFYPLTLLTFAITYGSGFIGSEEENGTLDILLAAPIRRWRVMVEKFAALIIFTLITILATYLGLVAGGVLSGIEHMPLGRIAVSALNMLPLVLFFAALALCLTGLRGGRGLALGAVLGLMIVSYLVYSMAEIADIPLWIRKLSPWYYYGGNTIMRSGLSLGHAGLLVGSTALLVGIGMWGFERRDVGV
jgi:ABC-2 type transport system permease protein